MAITQIALATLKQLIDMVPHRPVKMATIAYPDILVLPSVIEELCGETIAKSVRIREDSEKILGWHGLVGKLDGVVETRHFFSMLGVDVTVFDIHQVRGDELIQDMNEPLDQKFRNGFDIVYDGGTLEHCFNIGQAVKNCVQLARVGGYIYHVHPFNIANHGFYNFCPTFYHDFYGDNGHVLVSKILARTSSLFDPKMIELPPVSRFLANWGESTIMAAAQKRHDNAVIWPMQSKYKQNPHLAAS